MYHLNYALLLETKVNAIRHHSKEEAVSAVEKIKRAIKGHRFEIFDRDKNLDFLHHEHINKELACQIISDYITPQSLIAILKNRDREGELYLFSIRIPLGEGRKDKYIYMKCDITSYGVVKVISLHGQTEMMHPDYRQAIDKTDNDDRYFLRKLYQNWSRIYNKFNDNKMVDALSNGPESMTIVFESPIENIEEFKVNFCKTVPKDFGYKFSDIAKNMRINEGGDTVTVTLPFGHF